MNKMILRKMNTKFGRVLKRLVGEETGAVLMEYVILAVMIAAACVVAVIYFGKTANKQVIAGTNAMGGQTEKAASTSEEAKGLAEKTTTDSVKHADRFNDLKSE